MNSHPTQPQTKTLGQVAYEAQTASYGAATGKGPLGGGWRGLTPEMRESWEAAARAIRDALIEDLPK